MNFSWAWTKSHKWKLLLGGVVSLLLISPIPEVYDRQDNVITPLTTAIFLCVILCTARKRHTMFLLTGFTLGWFILSVVTDGSGLFAGPSLIAPLMFMALLLSIFLLLARWLTQAGHINSEVLCAAICGYLLLGVLWAGFYASVEKVRYLFGYPLGLVSTDGASKLGAGDWLYFSFTTLTTTGFGDIVPRGPEVRMLAVLEAMTGLFYNTIVIARFVGLYGVKVATQK